MPVNRQSPPRAVIAPDAPGRPPEPTRVVALKARCEKAWGDATLNHSALREAYRWLAPEREAGMNAGNAGAGQQRAIYDHMFDPVGMQALEDGAHQIAEAVHPWDQPWARWAPREDAEGAGPAAG